MTTEPVLLDVQRLAVSFPRGTGEFTQVVKGASFHVREGETLALVGESGSGKSVSAMSICRLLDPAVVVEGSIRFEGEDLVTASSHRLREVRGSKIGFVFQEPMTALNPVMTVGAQLEQALGDTRGEDSSADRGRRQRREKAISLLRDVNMPDPERRYGQYIHQLSGGQRQRALIAMAIAQRPRLLIADEPTTALDVTAQAEILDLLASLRDRFGMAVLLITHDMGVVAEAADRAAVMRGGVILETATTDDLFAAPSHEYTRALMASVPYLGRPKYATAKQTDGQAQPFLHVQDLSVRYRTPGRDPFMALDGVSFEVHRGELVGLVGESGSGKSTIGRTLVGLTRPSGGRVALEGRDVKWSGRDLRALRRKIGFVFQDPASSLNPRFTVGQSIASPLRWHGHTDRAAVKSRVAELLELVQLPASYAKRYPQQLSGGQRQRIGLARALALEPELLIADEPTSALDVTVQDAVLRLIKTIQADLSFSCLFISHDLAVIEELADWVIVLKSGRIVDEGPAARVLTDPGDDYTRRLIAAIPIPDPHMQRERSRLRRLHSTEVPITP